MTRPAGRDERPATLQDAVRRGAGALAARPLFIARTMGALGVVALACFAWGGSSGTVRGVLEVSLPGGWVSQEEGEAGNPFAVMLVVLAATALVTAALVALRRAAQSAWDERRIGRRVLSVGEALPAAVSLFGIALAIVAAMVALGADRDGVGVFAVRSSAGVAAGLLGLLLVWVYGWLRTLLLPRVPGSRAAARTGAQGDDR
ncbi:MAG: hypothetical protein RIB67_05040 [Miltoncostaeaceae bacterium]